MLDNYGLQTNPFAKRPKNALEAGVYNRLQWFNALRNNILNLLYSRFTWKNLPQDMPPFFIEQVLCTQGKGVFHVDKKFGLLFLGGGFGGQLNVYNMPTTFNAISTTYNKELNLYSDDTVLVGNNTNYTNELVLVDKYISTLAEIKKTESINLKTLATPFLLSANEKTKDSILFQYNQLQNGAPYVVVDPTLDKLAKMEVLNLNVNSHLDELQKYYNSTRSELLTLLGIKNLLVNDKKERLVTSEAEANEDEVMSNLSYRLEARQRAVEEANKKFGTEIEVEINDNNDKLSSDFDNN